MHINQNPQLYVMHSVQISKLNDADESVTTVLARCLPYIVPNVILAKREVSNIDCGLEYSRSVLL